MNIIETNLDFKKLHYTNELTAIILHHAAHSTCNVYDIHKWHKRDKGWSGIGYHFFITKDGKIYRGRPEKAVGAHCLNHNAYSIGICVQGDYMKESMLIEHEKVVMELCRYLCDKYKIETIKGHKELNPTSCPGENYPLERIKEEVFY
ncbi:peptidoglycan recognition protein family protein [Tepidibacter formicigenes]|uniref:N-acetylmuramoyl-L-alanine amidase n=1 Tax=Tepidibacter formicigenes DSM 15518 TaxID=1123349 RepID=A0A1M6TXL4_9FIRM|nr:peptidoglycan recognition family protein [Tepidibacter formicigenes]SHK61633.1 N-acetylmuramoyl-L-alanine amidase [Tepidibacter formicigenes DSM 15518]